MKDSSIVKEMAGALEDDSSSNLQMLKAAGTLIAGSILVTYIVSKYSNDPIESLKDWVMGKPIYKRKRKSKKTKNKNQSRNQRKNRNRIGEYHDYSEDSEELDDCEGNRQYLHNKGMSYISEEDSEDAQSSLCEDLLVPRIDDDATSITYTDRKTRKMYLNSNDELVEANQEGEQNLADCYVQPSKRNIKDKLYRQREIEAAKFISAVDKAVISFKKDRVKNYGSYQEAFKANRKEAALEEKLKENKIIEEIDSKEPDSLAEKYQAEIRQLPPKTRKDMLKKCDEKSVRLNDCLGEEILNKKEEDDSTLASEHILRSKKSDKKFVPDSKEFKSKTDYIFFELLSAYTENFVNTKTNKKKKKKRT